MAKTRRPKNSTNESIDSLISRISELENPVNAIAYLSANFAASTTIPINFDAVTHDSHSAITVSPTAWRFTAPSTGVYSLKGFLSHTVATNSFVKLYKNGVIQKSVAAYNTNLGSGAFAGDIRLNEGEYIDLRPNGSITYAGGSPSSDTVGHITITKVGA